MLDAIPTIGTTIIFRFGEAKPRQWKGQVIEHVNDEDGQGMRVFWPTMRFKKVKGVSCYHSIPNYTLAVMEGRR